MQTSTAVFLAFAVIYFGSVVLPFEAAATARGWTANAASLAAAVATFFAMKSHRLGATHAAAVLACMTLVAALAAMAVVLCVQKNRCGTQLPVHALVFSSGFLSGAAAYLGFLLGAAVGLPAWAAIVLAVVSAPLYITHVMPRAALAVNSAFDRFD